MTQGVPAVPGRRLNRRNADSVRQKIQTSLLVKILQDHARGEIEMTPTRIDAAKFLINKSMPNPPEDKNLNVAGALEVILTFVRPDNGSTD